MAVNVHFESQVRGSVVTLTVNYVSKFLIFFKKAFPNLLNFYVLFKWEVILQDNLRNNKGCEAYDLITFNSLVY